MNTTVADRFRESVLATPEVGVQTYEHFDGDATQRAETKQRFLDGDIAHPVGEYPLLSVDKAREITHVLTSLQDELTEVTGLSDAERSAYEGTLGYRASEGRFLIEAAFLNGEEVASRTDDSLVRHADSFQNMSHVLYGRPEQETVDGIVFELGEQFADATLTGQARELRDEVAETFSSLHSGSAIKGLPKLSEEATAFLEETLEREYGVHLDVIRQVRKDMQKNGETSFSPMRMHQVFDAIIHQRGYNTKGVSAFINENSGLMSWSQEKKGVSIGAKRSPIESEEVMWGITTHEMLHAACFINGRESSVPISGNGLFTQNKNGTVDYLTFEEGKAGLHQAVASGTPDIRNMAHILRTYTIALAEQGKTFPEIHDSAWKVLLLSRISSGDAHVDAIKSARSSAYDETFRVFRGTPMHRLGEMSMAVTYNKDLAYLKGTVAATNFWNQRVAERSVEDNRGVFEFLRSCKFDITDEQQREIAHAATNNRYRSVA